MTSNSIGQAIFDSIDWDKSIGSETIAKEAKSIKSTSDIHVEKEIKTQKSSVTTVSPDGQDQMLRIVEDSIIEDVPYEEQTPVLVEKGVPSHTFKTNPFDHQLVGYEHHCFSPFFALLMEQGTGKTKTTIDIADEVYRQGEIDMVLLIAPNGIHYQWEEEQVPEHSSIPNYSIFCWDSALKNRKWYQIKATKFANNDKDLLWLMINVEAFSTESWKFYINSLLQNRKTFIVIDESTSIKNPNSKRTKNILELSKHPNVVKKAILTGTPVSNSPFDLYSQFEFLKTNFWGINYFVFQKRHGVLVQDMVELPTGKKKRFNRALSNKEIAMLEKYLPTDKSNEDVAQITGVAEKDVSYMRQCGNKVVHFKKLDQIKAKIDTVSYIVKKEDCLDIPEKMFQPIYIDMSKEQAKVYTALKSELIAQYGGKELTVANKVSLTTRLMQIAGGFFPSNEKDVDKMMDYLMMSEEEAFERILSDRKPVQIGKKNVKIERLLTEIDSLGDSKLIVWATFVSEIKAIEEAIKTAHPNWRVELYYGGTHKKKRADIKKDFRDGLVNVLIANNTGAKGLNLQVSNQQIFFSNDFSLEMRLQKEDRSHRIGQKNTVLYRDFILRGTIDEKIVHALREKRDVLEYIRSATKIEDLV